MSTCVVYYANNKPMAVSDPFPTGSDSYLLPYQGEWVEVFVDVEKRTITLPAGKFRFYQSDAGAGLYYFVSGSKCFSMRHIRPVE